MIPISLELINFFSHKNSVVDFSQFDAALLIGNVDGNYDISNGSGKTSIFESILWCLFNKSRAASMDDIIFWGENFCKVVFIFKHLGETYRIIRKRNRINSATYVDFSRLDENDNWQDISGSTSSLTNSEIEKVIKVDYKTFINSAYFRQDDISEFAESDPARKKGILKSIIDISKWDTYEESAKDKSRELKSDLKIIAAKLEGYDDLIETFLLNNQKLDELKINLKSLLEQREQLEKTFNSLNQKYQELKKTLNTDQWDKTVDQIDQIKNKKNEVLKNNHKLGQNIEEYCQKMSLIVVQKDELLKKINVLKTNDNIDSELQELNNQVLNYQVSLNSAQAILKNLNKHEIISGQCYVCQQDITNDLYTQLVLKHQEEIKNQEAIITFSQNKLHELSPKVKDCQTVKSNNKIKDTYLSKIKNYETEVEILTERTNELRSKEIIHTSEIERLNNEESICQHILESIKNDDFKSYQNQLNGLKEQVKDISAKIEKSNLDCGILMEKTASLKEKIDNGKDIKKEYLEKQKRLAILEKTIKMFGKNGIQTILLDAIIEDLEKTANDILTSICNEPFMLFLDTQRIGSDGVSMVDTLDLRVKKDGIIQNFKSLSSGEQFRISLALRIALSEISSRHGGSALEFLLLDEVNSPLDRHGTESLFINVIRSLEKKYKILVITHNDALKEKFTNIIDVTKINGESSINYIAV